MSSLSELNWNFCPNCQPDYLNGFKKNPSRICPSWYEGRGCNKCGMGYGDDPKEFAELWIEEVMSSLDVGHMNTAMAVYVADGGRERIAEFTELVESWKDNDNLYNNGTYVIELAKMSFTGDWPNNYDKKEESA